MAMVYVKFQSSSDKIFSFDCSTRWPNTINCNIPMSGIYEGKYVNLMVMTGDETIINVWLDENKGKVIKITEEEINNIGQIIVPEGTMITQQTADGEVTFIAGLFTITNGQNWTLVE